MRTLALLLLIAACSKDDGGGGGSATAPAGSATGSAAKKGTGFSASLSAELAKEGSAAPSVPLASAGTSTGSAGGSAMAGSAATMAGSATVALAPKGSAASTPPPPPPPVPAGSAATPAKPIVPPPAPPPTTKGPRVPVKPPPELAAIKIDLEPNWERDIGEAGTISFVLNVPNSTDTRLFSFHYGYDPAGAPDDRDAYMKWLADNKLLSVSLNRQRGAAWYLEGSDGSGAPAFRTLVMYGGKHLVCWGSLYKDAASNSLGDLRDKVVMTAKQICGTMAL